MTQESDDYFGADDYAGFAAQQTGNLGEVVRTFLPPFTNIGIEIDHDSENLDATEPNPARRILNRVSPDFIIPPKEDGPKISPVIDLYMRKYNELPNAVKRGRKSPLTINTKQASRLFNAVQSPTEEKIQSNFPHTQK